MFRVKHLFFTERKCIIDIVNLWLKHFTPTQGLLMTDTILPLPTGQKKLFSNCCLLCFLLLSQLVVNEISVYRVKGEWFSSTFVFVSILLCHRQGLEGCSIKISLNISACSLHY